MRAKEEECGKLAMERDLLATQSAEQKELLVKTQREAEETETALLAEFASERSSWSDKEALLSSSFHEIKDIVDGESLCFLSLSRRPRSCRLLVFASLFCFFVSFADFFPGQSQVAIQAIEADRASRRAEGVEIAADAPRTLDEHILSIEARLRPAHRMLRRLQRVGAQAISALWLDMQAPRTPSLMANWLEVTAGRLEAWKGSSARARAHRALEFVKA